MRSFSQVRPTFWSGTTGRRLVVQGPEVALLALYLVTCPHANAVGLYHLPTAYIVNDLGIGQERVEAALHTLADCEFAYYDPDAMTVWIVNMARFQVGAMKSGDKLPRWVIKEIAKLPKCRFINAFTARYPAALGLVGADAGEPGVQAYPDEGQRIYSEIEAESQIDRDSALSSPLATPPASHPEEQHLSDHKAVVAAFQTIYRRCNDGAEAVLDKVAGKIIKDVLKLFGRQETLRRLANYEAAHDSGDKFADVVTLKGFRGQLERWGQRRDPRAGA